MDTTEKPKKLSPLPVRLSEREREMLALIAETMGASRTQVVKDLIAKAYSECLHEK